MCLQYHLPSYLAKDLSSYLNNYTIYAVRPQAASVKIAGFAIGQYSDIALDVIQKEYSIEMDVEQAIQLSNKAIEKALGERPMVQTGIITTKDGSFKKVVNNQP